MHLPTLLLPLLFTLLTTASLTISIPPSHLLPIPNSLPASTHATLTSLSPANHPSAYPLTAPLTRASTFVFPDLQPPAANPESFLLDIRAAQFVFAPLRVDVSADGRVVGVWETVPGTPWENRGVERFAVAADEGASSGRDGDGVNVEAKVVGRREFYQERTQCTYSPSYPGDCEEYDADDREIVSPLSLLKNPMVLIGIAALVFAFGMPKIMQNSMLPPPHSSISCLCQADAMDD